MERRQASKTWSRASSREVSQSDDRLWLGSYTSLTSWMRSAGSRLGISADHLAQVLSAGRAYAAFAERSRRSGVAVPALGEARVSSAAVYAARRVSWGRPEAFDRLIASLNDGTLSPTEVRAMATAGAGLRDRGRPHGDLGGSMRAEELLWGLDPASVGATRDSGPRFLWQAFPEVSRTVVVAWTVVTDCLSQPSLMEMD